MIINPSVGLQVLRLPEGGAAAYSLMLIGFVTRQPIGLATFLMLFQPIELGPILALVTRQRPRVRRAAGAVEGIGRWPPSLDGGNVLVISGLPEGTVRIY